MATSKPERVRRVGPLRIFFGRPEFAAIIGAILVWLVFASLELAGVSRGFLTVRGTANMLEVAAQIGILGSAVSLLMIAGEFDLSVGSMVGAAGMIVAIGIGQWGWPVWLAVGVAFAFALAVGFLNGWVVVKTGLPSFIVTLASLFMLRGATIGVTRLITGRTQVGGLDVLTAGDPVANLFRGNLFEVTEAGTGAKVIFEISILWWVVLALVATWVLLRTPFGNWIFGAGGSAVAARNVGVPVDRVKVLLFMATAASAALLACVQVLNVNSGDVLRGEEFEFRAIITAVIGGTFLTGGYGSAIGTFFGALTLGLASGGLFFVGLGNEWFKLFLGALLLVAVLVNAWIRQRASEAHR